MRTLSPREDIRVLRNVVAAHGTGFRFLASKAHEVLLLAADALAWGSDLPRVEAPAV